MRVDVKCFYRFSYNWSLVSLFFVCIISVSDILAHNANSINNEYHRKCTMFYVAELRCLILFHMFGMSEEWRQVKANRSNTLILFCFFLILTEINNFNHFFCWNYDWTETLLICCLGHIRLYCHSSDNIRCFMFWSNKF